MCIVRRLHEGGIHPFANAETDVHHICPILKRPADCTRPGPSRLSFTPKPRPKQCVGELEIPGLSSTTRTLFSGLRVSTHGKQAGPLVGFYHSAGRQPANSTPRPAGGHKRYSRNLTWNGQVIYIILTGLFCRLPSPYWRQLVKD